VNLLPCLSVTRDLENPGIAEDAGVELRRFLSLTVEPEARADLLTAFLNLRHDAPSVTFFE
jgi:hypothetical protein